MTLRQPGFLDKLLGLVPGYKGYAQRDARRTADAALRAHVAAGLDRCKHHVDDIALELAREKRLDGLDELDRLARRLGTAADSIRHAQHGGSGLMDDVVVKAEDLERVHEGDLALHEQAESLEELVRALTPADVPAGLPSRLEAASELVAAIERRNELFGEVFPCRS